MSTGTQAKQLRIPIYWFLLGAVPLLLLNKGDLVLLLNTNHSPAADALFKAGTYIGDGIILVPIILTLLFVRFRYAIIATMFGLVHCGLISLFKRALFSGMPRPTKLLDAELLHFVPGVDVHSHMSFPSGHTATAFAVALFFGLVLRKQWVTVLLMLVATFVAMSRMYLLQHFYVDVYAGMVIGTFSTLFSWQLCHAAGFFSRTDSRLSLRLSRVPDPQLSETKP